MKKLLTLTLVLSVAAMATAGVLNVQTYDIGESGGRAGTEADPLQVGDVLGVKIVLANNPAMSDGTHYPDYDGYYLSSMDVGLTADAGSLAVETTTNPMSGDTEEEWGVVNGLSPFSTTEGGNGYSSISGVALEAIGPGEMDIVWNLELTADGATDAMNVDLSLAGLSEYMALEESVDTEGWQAMTESDLGDATVYQVPEPATIALLGIGGLFLRRRRA